MSVMNTDWTVRARQARSIEEVHKLLNEFADCLGELGGLEYWVDRQQFAAFGQVPMNRDSIDAFDVWSWNDRLMVVRNGNGRFDIVSRR